MMATTIDSARQLIDVVREDTSPTTSRLVIEYTSSCRCGRPAHPDVDDPDRRVSSHRTAAGHVVYFRCGCGRQRFAHARWTS